MTNRERVIAALNFQQPDYTPHSVNFTSQMLDKMIAHTGNPNYLSTINNHILMVDLIKPQVEVRPEFFRDEYGIVWNKSGADKDIGVVDKYLLEDAEDLDSLEIPPVDEAFWGGISTQRDLPVKTPEEIRRITRELLAAFPHGGLVAAPTHDVPFDVPPENIDAMLSVLRNQK